MLLSIDWDAYSGPAEFVFDAPIWGTPDREYDRLEAWRVRAKKRGGTAWDALETDFPLYPGWEALTRYAGLPAHVTLSHASAEEWLALYPGREVLNIDSHHDLYSGPVGQRGGDAGRWRPGNWAGLGLAAGLISRYAVRYPDWHAGLPVTEGFDLARTTDEVRAALGSELLPRVHLERGAALPGAERVEAVLLVQSPAWSSPAHDAAFFGLAAALGIGGWGAEVLGSPPLNRTPG
ncbi:arginase [Deinococcus altitudinis]|uniref:arginase n=1 Tax=Deinococcus altitudinis TaxID=468914 RepID=UPI0038921034